MKKLVESEVVVKESKVVDEPGGLVTLLGKQVILLCANYFYAGKLVGVNTTCVDLESPEIVYETGAWSATKWADAQPMSRLRGNLTVQLSAIESFGEVK